MTNLVQNREQLKANSAMSVSLRWSAMLLVAVTRISASLFGIYIVSIFGGAALRESPEQWNTSLPALFDRAGMAGTVAIGAHFVAGGLLLLFGPVQLIGSVRRAAPALHRCWAAPT